MKMYRGKLTKDQVQSTIDELTCYLEVHRAIIIALLVVVVALTVVIYFNVTQSVTRGLSPKCQVLLEEQDESYIRECR